MRALSDRDAIFTFLLSNLLLLTSGGVWLIYFLLKVVITAKNAPTHAVPGSRLLVFGHRLNAGGEPSTDYRQRLNRAALCLQRYGNKVLLLGGVTRPGTHSEARAGWLYLRQAGAAMEQVATEDSSQNTLENLRKALPFLSETRTDAVVLLSNRYHLARVLTFARTMGIEASSCAAEDKFPRGLRDCWLYLREAYYLHWYVTGQYWAKLTGNQRMLDRLR